MAFSPDAAFTYLQRAHQQNRLGHAYLISGAPGSGKRTLASRLANLVNETKVEDVFSTRAREIFLAEPASKARRLRTGRGPQARHSPGDLRARPGTEVPGQPGPSRPRDARGGTMNVRVRQRVTFAALALLILAFVVAALLR